MHRRARACLSSAVLVLATAAAALTAAPAAHAAPARCPATIATHLLGASQYGAQWATDSTLEGITPVVCSYYGLVHTAVVGGGESAVWRYWSDYLSHL